MKEQTMITGLQPTGMITLGNYLGAIKQTVKMQKDYKHSYIFVADLHAITIKQDKNELNKRIKSLVALYLACGLDPEKNTIFIQSENPYHGAVSWLLECNSYYGEASRMIQFKEKSKKNENFTVGLLTYPVLMAADILIYDVDVVPVGIDQTQHVEFARDIAQRINKTYGEIFKLPKAIVAKEVAKISDLINPEKKMSKSSENQNGVIRMLDSETEIRKKIQRATTDSVMQVKYDTENQKGISNLIEIYAGITETKISEVEAKFKDASYKEFKEAVADVVVEELTKIQKKYNEIMQSDILDEILDKGKEETIKIAKAKYEELAKAIGLGR